MKPQNVIFGCVTDQNPKFMEQAVRLAASLRWFGGSLADSRFVVCSVDGLPEAYAAPLRQLGAELLPVERFDFRHAASNKLRFLEITGLEAYDTVVLMDCDTLIVQDPATYLPATGFGARLAGLATLKPPQFLRITAHFGLDAPPMDCRADISGAPIYPYFNSGVCLFARDRFPALRDAWLRCNRELIGLPETLDFPPRFTDQVSLAIALLEQKIPVTKLPSAMNFAVHYTQERYKPRFFDIDPIIMHYHEKADPGGGIADLTLPLAQKRAQLFNAKFEAAGLLPKETP